MKHAIVTGATGFVGQHLLRELSEDGVSVTAVVRTNSNITDSLADLPGVKIVVCPLEKLTQLPQAIGKVEPETVFFHLAWEGTSGIERTSVDLQLKNVSYTVDALKSAEILGCETFVGAGSIMEYESTEAVYNMNSVPALGNIYSTAKLTAHYMGRITAAGLNIRFIWPYITNAYGEEEVSPRFLNTTVKKILSGEEMAFSASTQIYDFIHVSDVARAFCLLGKFGKNGQTYCVGSGAARPLKEYLLQIKGLLESDAELNFGEKPGISLEEKYFDTNLLRADTGFSPKVSFEEGILRLKEQWRDVYEK